MFLQELCFMSVHFMQKYYIWAFFNHPRRMNYFSLKKGFVFQTVARKFSIGGFTFVQGRLDIVKRDKLN